MRQRVEVFELRRISSRWLQIRRTPRLHQSSGKVVMRLARRVKRIAAACRRWAQSVSDLRVVRGTNSEQEDTRSFNSSTCDRRSEGSLIANNYTWPAHFGLRPAIFLHRSREERKREKERRTWDDRRTWKLARGGRKLPSIVTVPVWITGPPKRTSGRRSRDNNVFLAQFSVFVVKLSYLFCTELGIGFGLVTFCAAQNMHHFQY